MVNRLLLSVSTMFRVDYSVLVHGVMLSCSGIVRTPGVDAGLMVRCAYYVFFLFHNSEVVVCPFGTMWVKPG